MKSILIVLCIVTSSSFGQVKQNTKESTNIKKEIIFHLNVLDSAARKHKEDTIYCCGASASLMEKYTDIETGTAGNMLARYGFTKEALKNWHKWFDEKYKKKR